MCDCVSYEYHIQICFLFFVFCFCLFDTTYIAPTSNLLCYSDDIWSEIKGDWIYSPSCEISNTNSNIGNINWIGNSLGNIPNSNYDYKSFILKVTMSSVTNIGTGGIIFRAQNVSSTNYHGQYYFVGFNVRSNLITLVRFNNEWITVSTEYNISPALNYSIPYTFKIHSLGNGLTNIWFEDTLIFENEQLNDYTSGSIGLATYRAPSTYYNVTLTQIFTDSPTATPSIAPTAPTKVPTGGMLYI